MQGRVVTELLKNLQRDSHAQSREEKSTKNLALLEYMGFSRHNSLCLQRSHQQLFAPWLAFSHWPISGFLAELRTLLSCLPGSIYRSLGNKQHAEVKLWNHTWLQRLLSCSLAVLLAASVSPSISVDLWGYCEN